MEFDSIWAVAHKVHLTLGTHGTGEKFTSVKEESFITVQIFKSDSIFQRQKFKQ